MNSNLKSLKDEIIYRFSGIRRVFLSADSVVSENPEDQKAMELKYPLELLDSIDAGSSLPDHEIKLKKVFVVMLLPNMRQICGNVNSTWYIIANVTKNLLFLQSIRYYQG